jgi:hypothetical protein
VIIISLPAIIPRFNFARERRLFRVFLMYYGGRAQRFQTQMDELGRY